MRNAGKRSRYWIVLTIIAALLLFALAAGITYLLLNLLLGGASAVSTPISTPVQATVTAPAPTPTVRPSATLPPTPTSVTPATETVEPTSTSDTEPIAAVTPSATLVPFVPAATATPHTTSDLTAFTVTLTPFQGTTYVSRDGGANFVVVITEQQLSAGDIVRTGAASTAILTYADNTEMRLFENTQIEVGSSQRDTDGNLLVRLFQHVGRTFNRVNFGANSTYDIETPTGVASVRGTSFWVEVSFSAHHGLNSEAIWQAIQTACLFQRPYLDFECARALGGEVAVFVDGASGVTYVTYTDTEGTKSIPLAPGQRFIMRLMLSNIPSFMVGSTTLTEIGGETSEPGTGFCGDSICDVYRDETTATCPEDCP